MFTTRKPTRSTAQYLRRSLSVFACITLGLFSSAFAQVCAVPGKDGPTTTGGTVNTYAPPAAAGTVGPAATAIALGVTTGATTPIAPGDLLVVMQMQCEGLNTTNTDSYGDGTAGGGRGYIEPAASCLAGNYEYVRAGAATTATSVDLTGSPLTNTYVQDATTVTNRRTFQIIRVPQYSSLTLNAPVTSPYWDGSTGGVVILDVAGALDWNGQSIDVSGRGFRGAGGLVWANAATTTVPPEFVSTIALNTHAVKGEGIAGTPRLVLNQSAVAVVDLGATWGGYAGGDTGRGAPGNAGGGGDNRDGTRDNGGGAGGGNGGIGGFGACGWKNGGWAGVVCTAAGEFDLRGIGGADFAQRSASRVVMGGGGGGGGNNNSPAIGSSGGAGGGIVMVRAGSIAGTGTINANGALGQTQAQNDGAGGGGAGGSVLVYSTAGGVGTLVVNATGGTGGNSFLTGTTAHAGGGGGAGGFVVTSTAAVTNTLAGGPNGTTNTGDTPANASHGATPGAPGNAIVPATDPLGNESGARCLPQVTTTKSTSTPAATVTLLPGATTTYTINVANAAGLGTAQATRIADTLPANPNLTYAAAPAPTFALNPAACATRTVTTNPVAGATALSFGDWDIPGGCTVSATYTVTVGLATNDGVYQNDATTSFLDPTRLAAEATRRVTPLTNALLGNTAYASGGTANVGGSNYDGDLAANTAEEIRVARQRAYKSVNRTVDADTTGNTTAGDTLVWSIFVQNPSNTAITNFQVSDALQTGMTITAVGAQTITATAGTCGAVSKNLTFNGAGSNNLIAATQTLPAGCTLRIDIPVTVNANFTGTSLANQVLVTGNAPAGALPSVSSDNIDLATPALPAGVVVSGLPGTNITQTQAITIDPTVAPVLAKADLRITKTDAKASTISGASNVYTITVTNNGPSAANNATLTDAAIAGLTCSTVTCAVGTGAAVCPATGAGAGQLSVSNLQGAGVVVPALPAVSSLNFTLTCSVNATGI
jgi:uncharacterized repeat protein (TIGR01451 family)